MEGAACAGIPEPASRLRACTACRRPAGAGRQLPSCVAPFCMPVGRPENCVMADGIVHGGARTSVRPDVFAPRRSRRNVHGAQARPLLWRTGLLLKKIAATGAQNHADARARQMHADVFRLAPGLHVMFTGGGIIERGKAGRSTRTGISDFGQGGAAPVSESDRKPVGPAAVPVHPPQALPSRRPSGDGRFRQIPWCI